MQHYPVKFSPLPQERIWGGDSLKEWFGVQSDTAIGEYWVLSGHQNGLSVVMNGEFAGKTLEDLIREYPEAYLGNSPQERFPLLIKFLEANDDLSVQIHPGDDYANEVENDYGKTEAWYILDCKEDGQVVYGHTFQNREAYERAIEQKKVAEGLKYKDISKEEVVFVPSQTLHALLSGTIVLEIQQTSDVTYRVYDWDRIDDTGKGRELHTDKAADVMVYEEELSDEVCAKELIIMANEEVSNESSTEEPNRLVATDRLQHELLVSCDYFTIEKVMISAQSFSMTLGNEGNPDILIVTEGEGELDTGDRYSPLELKRGDTVLIPSTIHEYKVRTSSTLKMIKTYY